MNKDNLEMLLYTNEKTKRDLLQITHYEEQAGNFILNANDEQTP
jgi:hypothetical protein